MNYNEFEKGILEIKRRRAIALFACLLPAMYIFMIAINPLVWWIDIILGIGCLVTWLWALEIYMTASARICMQIQPEKKRNGI